MNSDRQYERTMELWRSYSIATSLELAAHLENFAILFSYNSGKIENREITYHDTHEIFKNGRVCGYTGDLRTLYEIKNLKDASELMYRWFDERKPISLDSIREMQFELTKGTYDERRWELGERPGEFKKNDLWGVGMHDVAAPVDEIENDLHLARRYSDILEVCLGFSCFHCFVILPSLKAMRRSVPSHHDGQRRVQF